MKIIIEDNADVKISASPIDNKTIEVYLATNGSDEPEVYYYDVTNTGRSAMSIAVNINRIAKHSHGKALAWLKHQDGIKQVTDTSADFHDDGYNMPDDYDSPEYIQMYTVKCNVISKGDRSNYKEVSVVANSEKDAKNKAITRLKKIYPYAYDIVDPTIIDSEEVIKSDMKNESLFDKMRGMKAKFMGSDDPNDILSQYKKGTIVTILRSPKSAMDTYRVKFPDGKKYEIPVGDDLIRILPTDYDEDEIDTSNIIDISDIVRGDITEDIVEVDFNKDHDRVECPKCHYFLGYVGGTASSDYIEDAPYCRTCMEEYCATHSCEECDLYQRGKNGICKFKWIKDAALDAMLDDDVDSIIESNDNKYPEMVKKLYDDICEMNDDPDYVTIGQVNAAYRKASEIAEKYGTTVQCLGAFGFNIDVSKLSQKQLDDIFNTYKKRADYADRDIDEEDNNIYYDLWLDYPRAGEYGGIFMDLSLNDKDSNITETLGVGVACAER